MKFIDNKGRLFGKISFIDVLAILAVLALGAGLLIRNFSLETTAANTPSVKFSYTAKIQNVSDMISRQFRVGDKIYNEASGEYYGTISDVEVKDAEVWNANAQGEYVKGTSVDRKDVYITVDAEGIISNGRHLIGRTNEIEPNYQCYMYSKYVKFFFYVMEIY